MNETESGVTSASATELQRCARGLLRLDLTVLGAAFAWFAYVDAPITDGAMRLIAAAVLAGLLSIVAALICAEAKTERVSRRCWRVAVWAFAVTAISMLTAATATLNLKGSGSEESDTQTTVVMPA